MKPIEVFRAYPDSDLLPYPEPGVDESGAEYYRKIRRECHRGDTLFEFLISELCDDDVSDEEILQRAERALSDVQVVVHAAARKVLEAGATANGEAT